MRNAYSYSADGVKLRVVKKYNSNFNTSPVIGSAVNTSKLNVTQTTDYVDGKIFENNVLDRIFVDGGYIKNGVYYFYETDHLGDNRTVINQSGTVVERNDYYPFGMQMAHNQLTNSASGSDNKRKFSGKELDVMHGLNLYDSQARWYDPCIPILPTPDPKSEKYYSISPYVYCGDNPLRFVDPDGKLKFAINFSFGVGQGTFGVGNEFLGVKGAPLGHSGYDFSISLSFDTDKKTLSLEGSAGYNQTKSSFGFGVLANGHESSLEKNSTVKGSVGFNFDKMQFEAKGSLELDENYKDVQKTAVGIYTNTTTEGNSVHSIGLRDFAAGIGILDGKIGLDLSAEPSPSPSTTTTTAPSTSTKPNVIIDILQRIEIPKIDKHEK